MKKIIIIITMIFIVFNNNVNASLLNDFETSCKSVNEYINNETHQPYFVNGNNIYFEFKNSKINSNTDFLKGGLLNLEEFNISIYKNKTYLNGINNYWTMTYTTDKAYIIDLKEKEIFKNNLSKVRMTQYVKNNIKISGSGTYKDPWKFNKLNTVIFISTDETKGTVEPTKSYIFDNEGLAIKVSAKNGYEYASNTCDIETASNNGINIYNIQKDMYCEVSFKEKTYTLTYDNNGGNGCTSKTIIFENKYGELCEPSRTGYTFAGWYTELSGGIEVTEDTALTEASDQTIYAHWTANKYTLTYNNNGGSGCTSKQVTYGETYGELCTPVRNGYTFKGWYTLATGGTQVTASTTTTGNATIHAHWTANKYTLTYDNNGGSGCTSKQVTYGETYGELCTPVRNGYTFKGWYTLATGGTQVTASTTTTGNATIHAHWTANKYTLTYNNNGGSGCTSKQVTYGETYGPLCTPVRAGYAFDGWYTSTSYETKITNATKVTSELVLKVYAKWKVSSTIPVFTYTGNYSIVDDNNNVIPDTTTWTGDWKIRFTSSGTLNFITLNSATNGIDLFLVGGGAGGRSQGGTVSGGSGGRTNTFTALSVTCNTNYSIIVGSGGSSGGGAGGSSSAFGRSVNGGTVSGGGSGGGGYQICCELEPQPGGSYGKNGSGSYSGTGQGCTTCEFGEGTTSGCTKGDNYAYAGGGAGVGASGCCWTTTSGGKGGGGNSGYGGNVNNSGVLTAGSNGTDGKGGGGGFGNPGGKGGSGIVIIRNKRTTAVTTCN